MNISILLKSISSFFILLVLQILIFNNIGITSWDIVPAFYILILILLPFETPDWLILLIAFIVGLIIDIFADTLGLSASVCLLVSFLRPFILRSISPRGGYDQGSSPRVQYMGLPWFFQFSLMMILIHQATYYFLENYGFDNFGQVLVKILIGSFFSLILIILSQFLVYRK
jgi:rod shape-determining protein MreD